MFKSNTAKALAVTFGLALLFLSVTALALPVNALSANFNMPGNVLVTDQFNNRVIEINPATNRIVWGFGTGDPTNGHPGAHSIIGPNWAERLSDGFTVMAGTGIPPGASSKLPSGAVDNRVIVVNKYGSIVWQYGQAGVTGSRWNQLNVPTCAIQLPNFDLLITDQGNNRIIEVTVFKEIVWSYGPKTGPGALNSPNSAELLPNGHILIADEGNNRVIEITRGGSIVWQYSAGINLAAFASRLPNGHTLITDSGNSRIIEVTPLHQIVFQYFTNKTANSNAAPLPTNAVRLKNGNTIIADQFNDRVIIISSTKQIVWHYGHINVPGNTTGLLNAPYTAFVIGDYTGQTKPPIF